MGPPELRRFQPKRRPRARGAKHLLALIATPRARGAFASAFAGRGRHLKASLLHDAIDQAVRQGLLRAEEVVAVEVQCHLLARLAAQLRVVGDLETGRRGRRGKRASRALIYIAGERECGRARACDDRRRSGLTRWCGDWPRRVDTSVRTTRSRMPRIISASTLMLSLIHI